MQRPARCEHTQIRRLRPDTWKPCREDTLIARHAIVLLVPPRRCTPRPCAGPTGVTNVSDEEKINQLFLLLVCVDLLPQAIANRLLDCYSDKTIIVFSPFSDNSTREGWISLIAAVVFAQSVRR